MLKVLSRSLRANPSFIVRPRLAGALSWQSQRTLTKNETPHSPQLEIHDKIKNAGHHYKEALWLLEADKPDKALKALRLAISADPLHHEAILLELSIQRQKSKTPKTTHLTKALKIATDPTVRRQLLVALIEVYKQLDRYYSAFTAIQEELKLLPNDIWLLHHFIEFSPRGFKAKSKTKLSKLQEPILRRILSTECHTPSVLLLSSILDEEDKEEEAFQLVKDALDKNPTDVELIVALAVRYTHMKPDPDDMTEVTKLNFHQKKAVALLNRAIELNPNHTYAHLNLGVTLVRADPSQASHHFNIATNLAPSDPEIFYNIGHVHHQAGNLIEAQTRYNKVILLDPAHYQARINLGLIYQEKGNLKVARIHYINAMSNKPQNHQGLILLGGIAQTRGEFTEAIAIFQEACIRAPQDWVIHMSLASVYKQMQDTDNFEQSKKKCIQLNPEAAEMFKAFETENNEGEERDDEVLQDGYSNEEDEDEDGWGDDPQDIAMYEQEGIDYQNIEAWIQQIRKQDSEEPGKPTGVDE